ncbi:hypothetical protein BJY01DRAFT_120261 [Aspergillus pseudoustus]|uniref:LPXTG-domain-containing protein n=1 Tax=Aspergillus pseudoustus TaxID=1810923 RepID=A0ABR4KFX7_9EURO
MRFVVLLAAAANAVTLSAPQATLVKDIKSSARLAQPPPTAAPATPEDLHLLARQDTVAQADPTVCGYYTRDADSRLYCLNNNACVFYAPDSEFPGMVGCCPTTSATSGTNECIIFSTCIDIADILATSDLLAQTTDSMALFCTYDGNQYCHTRTWPGLNAADFECTSTSSAWLETMYTFGTLTDEDDAEDQSTESLSISWISSSDLPTDRSVEATTTTETETSTTESTTSQTQTSTSVDEQGATITDGPDDSGSSTPVGAIVGGVVGGVGGLALIAGALFLYRRHKKKSVPVEAPVIPPPDMKQQPGVSTTEAFAPPKAAPPGVDTTGMHEAMAEPMYAELPVQEARNGRVVRHELE